MNHIQKIYALAKSAHETARLAALEDCKENLKQYSELTGNESDEILDAVLEELDAAELAADEKHEVGKFAALLEQAENQLIEWGRGQYEKAMTLVTVEGADNPVILETFEKALAGHFIARKRIIETVFNLKAA